MVASEILAAKGGAKVLAALFPFVLATDGGMRIDSEALKNMMYPMLMVIVFGVLTWNQHQINTTNIQKLTDEVKTIQLAAQAQQVEDAKRIALADNAVSTLNIVLQNQQAQITQQKEILDQISHALIEQSERMFALERSLAVIAEKRQ